MTDFVWEKQKFTDEEINELSDWLQDLTIHQLMFIKEQYILWLSSKAQEQGCVHVQ